MDHKHAECDRRRAFGTMNLCKLCQDVTPQRLARCYKQSPKHGTTPETDISINRDPLYHCESVAALVSSATKCRLCALLLRALTIKFPQVRTETHEDPAILITSRQGTPSDYDGTWAGLNLVGMTVHVGRLYQRQADLTLYAAPGTRQVALFTAKSSLTKEKIVQQHLPWIS